MTLPRRERNAGLLGAAMWSCVAAFAAVAFASQNSSGWDFSRGFYSYREILGFGVAFAVAGAASGICTFGILAGRRAALTMSLVLFITFTASYLLLWLFPSFIARTLSPSPVEWLDSNRKLLLSYVVPGLIAGVVLGLLVSLMGTMVWLCSGRGQSRYIAPALALALVAMVALIPIVSSTISEIGIDLRWKYGWSEAEVMYGVGSGATTGAIAGVLTAALVARASRPRSKPQQAS